MIGEPVVISCMGKTANYDLYVICLSHLSF